MVNVKLDVHDIGKLLVRLGQPEGVRRGTAKLEGPLSWSGNPSEVDYATLSGNFVLEANKGQFLKLDPGIGKLLGVMSLQSAFPAGCHSTFEISLAKAWHLTRSSGR